MTTLRSLLDRLDELADDLTLYVAADTVDLTPDTPATAAEEPADGSAPPGMRYLLDVPPAKDAVEVWRSRRRGREPSVDQRLEAIAYYAEHDAYLPP